MDCAQLRGAQETHHASLLGPAFRSGPDDSDGRQPVTGGVVTTPIRLTCQGQTEQFPW